MNIKKFNLMLKYLIDFILALVLLIIFLPVFLILSFIIMLDSKGPMIYRQKRVGTNGELFTIYKFRTMKIDTPCISTEEMQRLNIDPVTRVGHFLRKSSLDELPQLINIIKCEMSFVGPRPALPSQIDVNTKREELGVHMLRPGITGLAQVMGRDDLDTETKVNYDAEYCRKVSVIFDLKIIILTIIAIISSRGNK